MRTLPIDILRAFSTVVEARGFTRAAEQLGRSQPTISLQVKRLEELVGRPLFENNLRLKLTEVGAVCFEHAEKILKNYDDMMAAIAESKKENESVRIGLPSELATLVMPQLSLAAAQNACKFEIHCDEQNVLVSHYNARNVDVLVACRSAGEAGPREPAWRAEMGWACAPGYVVPPKEPLSLVLTPPGSLYRQLAIDAVDAARRRYEIACVSADFNVLKAAVRAKLGVAPMIAPAIEILGMSAVRDLPRIVDVEMSIVHRKKRNSSVFEDELAGIFDNLFRYVS